MVLTFLFLLNSLLLASSDIINICNNDLSVPNCNERSSHYECTKLLQTDSDTICACNSSIKVSVIIIIDASNHTINEWQSITLKWLQLYYDMIYSSNSQQIQLYYMLSHGDFTLVPLNENPAESDLATDSFMNNLDELSKPNACVAFKRANQWIRNQQQDMDNMALIYYAKATPFAPSFKFYCREEHEQYKLIQGEDIFAIRYHENINLNYVQRDIGEFEYEMTIFSDQYHLESNNETDKIASSIVAAISDFICIKGIEEDSIAPTPTLTPSLIVAPANHNVVHRGDDCCSHASGIEYDDIKSCDRNKTAEIEYMLNRDECLLFCDPFHYYSELNIRDWDCIKNYALWVQYYHICSDLGIENENKINQTMWNDYKWHCPICYNTSIDAYKSICTSVDGEQLLDVYIEENCDCKDVTLFLVIIIEITALLFILIGMFILWYRFNVYKVNQHLKEKSFTSIQQMSHNPEQRVLNDITDDGDSDSDLDIDS